MNLGETLLLYMFSSVPGGRVLKTVDVKSPNSEGKKII